MSDFQLSLPNSTIEFINEKIATGQYRTPSEVVIALVEDARQREARDFLHREVQKGLDSELGPEVTEDYLRQRRLELLSRLPAEFRE